jgi:hypothetical protein
MAAMANGRTIKRGLFALVAAVSLGASQMVASADTLTAIGIDCGDGYPISATVDGPTLTKVQGAIQAMIDTPAGLSCSLTTSALPDPSLTAPTTTTTTTSTTSTTTTSSTTSSNTSPSNTNSDAFVTGGGQYTAGSGCQRNFGLSAKPDKNSTTFGGAHGTSNVTQPNAPGCPQGHVTSTVLCLVVGTDGSGNGIAQIKSSVTQVDGVFTQAPFLGAEGQVIETDVTDGVNGNPDQIVHFFQGSGPAISSTCDVPSGGSHMVTHGNIKIHNS